ncbi:hypothetical protein [Williamsia soli]|uniref:hypothetical protein n=1 Tax=Williamsia soli TaxID=364929 RepID=UPI001F3A3818|nr:hypothetical protein [Williamsia soli]
MWAWVHIIRRLSERADPAALEQAHIVAPVIFQAFGSHDAAHTSHLTAEALESRFEAPPEIALVIALLIGNPCPRAGPVAAHPTGTCTPRP